MSVNSIMKQVGRALEFLAWAVFFACAALVLALRFWVLPDIERYREPIVAAVSRSVGQPVSIGRIEARWFGLHPRLELTDVRIHDREGREALVLPRVENVVSWRSLLRGEPKLRSLVIDGLRLQVRRDASGALYVAGRKLTDEGSLSDWALVQEEIVLRDAEIEWHDEKRGAPPLALSALNLRLRNDGDVHAIGIAARPPAALGSTVELRALFEGRSLADPAAWSGRLFAEFGYTDLAAWRAWIDYPWEVSRGEGAVRLWLSVERGEVKQATADLAAAQVAAMLGPQLAPLQLASVQGRLKARAHEGAYELGTRGLALAIEQGPSIAPVDFQLRWKPAGGGSFAAGTLELEPLAYLAASLPFPAPARRMLAEIAPRGRLAETRLQWTGPVDAPESFHARGSFSGLAAAPSGHLPGFAGLSGSFDTTDTAGRVRFDSWKSELELPRVLPEPRIALDMLNGQVEWERQVAGGFSVRLLSVNLANAHFSGNLYGAYSWSGSGPGTADLSAQFNRADASHAAKYLPHASLVGGQETRDWLLKAIVAGHSGDVRVRLRGDLADFPFTDPLRGEFSVLARVENGVLNYADGWPQLRDISGELLFERDRMEVNGKSASVLGVTLANVRIGIPRLDDPKPRLEISGEAHGPTANFLDFVQASPVRGMVDNLTDGMQARGQGRLRLKLQLPLTDPDRTRLAGEYQLIENNIVVHRDLPAIERASGTVAFTQAAVRVQDVRGQLFGGTVALSGGTRSDGSVEILAKGEATVAGARPFFDDPLGKYLSGGAPYSATLRLVEGRTRFTVESSLRGLASALPPPLAKPAAEELALRLELEPLEGGRRERIQATLGRLARLELQRRREGEAMRLQRAALALTPAQGQAMRLPESGLLVYGSLSALDVDKWLPLLGGGRPADRAAFDVKIGELDLYGKRVHELALRGVAQAGGWSASVGARELAGELSYAGADGGKLVARLTHFRTPEDYPGAAPRGELAPKALPSVDMTAERFTFRGKELGRVELAARRSGEDWLIEKLAMANADATFHGKGAWRGGAPTRSTLDFSLQASDAGEFLNRIGYKGLVRGGRAQLQGSLSWNGEPVSLDYASLAGDVQLQAQDGQFLEIEPGLGKLVSLMSLQSLPRRITLDFRDVFSKGFEFERIASSGHIERGIMAVRDFRMRGSSAQVDMTGEVDLAAETQDLRVRVVPSLGDSASTVIALANPLLAIPAAIVQKILKDPLGHIFAFDYAVTGGWSEPKVAKLGVEARAVQEQ